MPGQERARHRLAVLAVLLGCGLGVLARADADSKDEPGPLPPEVVKGWHAAGARAGWMKDVPPDLDAHSDYWEPFRDRGGPGAVPAFRYHPEKDGVLARLPDPGVPFGLDTHCCAMNDRELKELAGLKSLRSLNLGGALLLTDAGLKELAGLKKLRALDLSHTRVRGPGLKDLAGLKNLQALNLADTEVTDAGLKELARLKNLQWLSLYGTQVTAAGVAALQQDLPGCKIMSERDWPGRGK